MAESSSSVEYHEAEENNVVQSTQHAVEPSLDTSEVTKDFSARTNPTNPQHYLAVRQSSNPRNDRSYIYSGRPGGWPDHLKSHRLPASRKSHSLQEVFMFMEAQSLTPRNHHPYTSAAVRPFSSNLPAATENNEIQAPASPSEPVQHNIVPVTTVARSKSKKKRKHRKH